MDSVGKCLTIAWGEVGKMSIAGIDRCIMKVFFILTSFMPCLHLGIYQGKH